MAKFFVSYARIDSVSAEQIIETLRQRYNHANVWYDQELHNRGGENWWEEILNAIDQADIFVYLLSKESVESPYCQAEFEEAQRLKKRLIFIQVRDRTPLPATIASRQYTDMSKGVDNLKTWTSLYNSIDYQISQIPKRKLRPVKPERTPRPQQAESAQVRPIDAPAQTTPKLEHITLDEVREPAKRRSPRLAFLGVVLAVVGIGTFAILSQLNQNPNPEVTPGPTNAIAQITAQTPDAFTPTLSGFQQLQTTEAELTESAGTQAALELRLTEQFISDSNTTATAQMFAVTETAAYATLLALSATPTPSLTPTPTITPTSTPDLASTAVAATQAHLAALATLDVQATREAHALATSQAEQTAVAQAPLPTVQVREVQIVRITTNINANVRDGAGENFSVISSAAPNSTYALLEERNGWYRISDGGWVSSQIARVEQATEADWTPLELEFDGVTMVQVPPGCFTMGSEAGDTDEKPVHEQCFDTPFWIDKTEVTLSQFQRLGGIQAKTPRFSEANRPINNITWFEARDFCALRSARLPTEAEWEYAARGPVNSVYPWGDEWNESYVAWSRSTSQGTADVGSIPAGSSWVGALDMSGNVWEWTNSLYESYPYDAVDGREADIDSRTDARRVLRGGSWINTNSVHLRGSNRSSMDPTLGYLNNGVRCARSYKSP